MISLRIFRTVSQGGVCLAGRHWGGGRPTVSVERLHVTSGLDRFCGRPAPRQQFIEAIDRVSIDHALEHVVQISVGLDVVHLGCLCRPANYAEQARFPHDSH